MVPGSEPILLNLEKQSCYQIQLGAGRPTRKKKIEIVGLSTGLRRFKKKTDKKCYGYEDLFN